MKKEEFKEPQTQEELKKFCMDLKKASEKNMRAICIAMILMIVSISALTYCVYSQAKVISEVAKYSAENNKMIVEHYLQYPIVQEEVSE